MSGYTRPVCRGSWALGTACGECERCEAAISCGVVFEPKKPGPIMDAAPAIMDADDWTPDERTIRHCIEALPYSSINKDDRSTCVEALEALLPKPDPAKSLVRQWAGNLEADRGACSDVIDFLHWATSHGFVTLDTDHLSTGQEEGNG